MIKIEQKKYKRLIIYPSYSLRDYKKSIYLLDGDAEFNQMLYEAKILKKYFEEIYMIIPEHYQRQLELKKLTDHNIHPIVKKYQVNVGAERFSDDEEFFKSLNLKDEDILYSNFLNKWILFDKIGLNLNNIMYTFQYFYPEFHPNTYIGLNKYKAIIFHSNRAKEIFESKSSITNKTYVINSDPGPLLHHAPYFNSSTFKIPVLMIPARLDHEDFNHTWETLSIALSLKLQGFEFRLIVCNPNDSADIGFLSSIADELGPFTRERFMNILSNEQGVILMLKEADYGGSKGAPEYLASNLLFVSYDYKINPLNLTKRSGTTVLPLVKKLLSLKRDDYIDNKRTQKLICNIHHGKENTLNTFKKIFGW